ncbi:MAG: Flagellin [candidate division BRC1 bacterium ADurb.BinA292]|nr:MAG: Flagellin [candidate division BRC1 bacterium ADurb.BinA292]
MHNRLETLTGSLARRVEDLSGADSAIRDTDFAFETARLTQAQILQEASLSLLAQANISPRRALELLQR